jgi:GxxExxY protein
LRPRLPASGRCSRRAETLDSIAFGVGLRFNGQPLANGHKKHKGAQEVRWESINQLCDVVRETSFAIHKYHRNGHLEKVYENALAHRLRKQGLEVKRQHPLTVYDEDGTILGVYFADLFVEDSLMVELKACQSVRDEHVAQLIGYLKPSRVETGLLVNFGAAKLHVKKYLMTVTDH